MMQVAVASTNPVKQRAAKAAFQQAFEQEIHILGGYAASGVSEQPLSNEETYQGAYNRARHAKLFAPEADFWVGIEGGVADLRHGMEAFGWAVVLGRGGKLGAARSNTFLLPPSVALAIRAGGELGPIMDQLFEQHNTKQQGGAVGLLTKGLFDRQTLYQQAVLLALIPFLQPELY
jgi:inosine/xanthosine triphosphatase